MNLGDIVIGDFPTRYGSMQVFPNAGQILASTPTIEADQDGWFPNSIGQDTGRYAMKGPLPGRYYGPGWLAPNSGFVPSVAVSLMGGNGAADYAPAGQLDGSGPVGPVTLTNPLPSVTAPRPDQQTVPGPSCAIAEWVAAHPLLAVGAAALVFFGISGGRK